MLLTIDIGNSLIGMGLFEGDTLVETLSLQTLKKEQVDHYYSTIKHLFSSLSDDIKVTKIIVASVVPSLTIIVVAALKKLFKLQPLILAAGVKTGIVLKVDHPLEVGADIVACAVGAFHFGNGPFIIVDLGTANKYIYVDSNHVFHGVAISPGLTTSFSALIRDADQLLSVPFIFTKKVLGKNTKDSLSSGIMYSLLDEVQGFVTRIEAETLQNATILLTGGNSIYIKDKVPARYIYEPNLVHYGLSMIEGKNNEK